MRLLLQQEHGQVGLARRRQWKHYSQKKCFCLLGPKPGYRAAKKALKTALALNLNQIKYLACRIIIYQRQEMFQMHVSKLSRVQKKTDSHLIAVQGVIWCRDLVKVVSGQLANLVALKNVYYRCICHTVLYYFNACLLFYIVLHQL